MWSMILKVRLRNVAGIYRGSILNGIRMAISVETKLQHCPYHKKLFCFKYKHSAYDKMLRSKTLV